MAEKTTSAEPSDKTGSTRGRFTRVAKANVTQHGYMTAADAERVFRETMKRYDLGDTKQEEREEFLGCLTEALAVATSTEVDYSQVFFEYDGETYTLDPLDDAATSVYAGDNPLRTWVRSFRNGEMCLRISDFLGTPQNVGIRQAAAARYGMAVSDAYLCFDCADGLLKTDRTFSLTEMRMIKAARAFATDTARIRAQVDGGGKPMHETSGRVGFNTAEDVQPRAAPEARAGFKSVR